MDFFKQIQQIIQQHLDEQQPINVGLLAECLCLDRTQVYRKIKREKGKSPAVLIRETKLEYGRVLLLKSNHTIMTIAHRSGFTSESYFIQCFREKYDTTPQEYRKKYIDTT